MKRMANVILVVLLERERGEGNGEKKTIRQFYRRLYQGRRKSCCICNLLITYHHHHRHRHAGCECLCVQNVRYLTSILGQQPLARTTIANQFHILYVSSRQPIQASYIIQSRWKNKNCGMWRTVDRFPFALLNSFFLPASSKNRRPCSVPYLVCIVLVYARQ